MAKAGFAAPQGEIRLDPENSHFYLWPRIGRVDARSKVLTVSLHGIDGRKLYSVEVPPEA